VRTRNGTEATPTRGRSKSPVRARGRSKSPRKAASPTVKRFQAMETTAAKKVEVQSEEEEEEFSQGWFFGYLQFFFLAFCPMFGVLIAFMTTDLVTKHGKNPSFSDFYTFCSEKGHQSCFDEVFLNGGRTFGDAAAWRFLGVFMYLSLLLFWWPGKTEYGPRTKGGHLPEYKDNGFTHCILFNLSFFLGSTQVGDLLGYQGWYSLSIIFDNYSGTIGALNVFGLSFCSLLYVKGIYFPSGPDHVGGAGPKRRTGIKGICSDYFWGMELYPRFFDLDVKKFVNCRFSMTYWMLSGISFAVYSYNKNTKAGKAGREAVDPGVLLAAISQFVYLVKFFWWEIGYMRSIDIIVDRAGFYETWGCLVWVPTIYTCHSRILATTDSGLSWPVALVIFGVGMVGVLLNFWADDQRQYFRAQNGNCLIWGQQPRFIECTYTTKDYKTGATKSHKSLLLASGWWGIARHLQYFFELMAAWSWVLLANPWKNGFLTTMYAMFLTFLLIDRASRDQEKCLAKYGDGYREYMALVPYKIIPGVF